LNSKIFDCGIPDENLELVIEKTGGGRFKIPTSFSRNNRIYRKKRNVQICRHYDQGIKLDELSSKFKLSKMRISQILKENGIQVREGKKKSLKEEVEAMLKVGYSVTEIAKKTRYSRAWIYEVKKELK